MILLLRFTLFVNLVVFSTSTKAVEIVHQRSNEIESVTQGIVIDIEHGEPKPVIDSVGWLFGIPNKLLLWDRRADNHDVSSETIEETASFLAENRVDGVKVRVNQYDPLGEWQRLIENDRIGFGWRATVGSLYTLGYSVIPGRLFGNDWYNPYTDSVHVYSDIPSLAMEQAAHAKDVHDRSHPGFYSAMQLLPLVGIVHEARSKQSVFNHVDEFGTPEERAEARRILMPQLGSEIGGQATLFVPQGDAIFQLTGAAIGHAVGRYEASQIEMTPTSERKVSFRSPLADTLDNSVIDSNVTDAEENLLNDVSTALFSENEGNQNTPYDNLFQTPSAAERQDDLCQPAIPLKDSDFTVEGFVDYSLPLNGRSVTPME